jgi:hypothetical protein
MGLSCHQDVGKFNEGECRTHCNQLYRSPRVHQKNRDIKWGSGPNLLTCVVPCHVEEVSTVSCCPSCRVPTERSTTKSPSSQHIPLTTSLSEVCLETIVMNYRFLKLIRVRDHCSGGTAGNTVANRLTENHDIQVLVLEAGGRFAVIVNILNIVILTLDHSNEGVTASIIPLLFPTLSPNTVSSDPVDSVASFLFEVNRGTT